jgi:hypothetical protein
LPATVNEYSVLTKEPFSLNTREDDNEWSNLVNLVMKALYTADMHNITKSSVTSNLDVFRDVEDDDFKSVIVSAVGAVGNIGEMYQRHLSDVAPRRGLNTLNDGSTGLIYSFPFGIIDISGELKAGGVIESILARGRLRCGVTKKVGFAGVGEDGETWTGLDVDYCRAVAAALFSGGGDIDYVEIQNGVERFPMLAKGQIDLLAGERVSLLNGYREPTTGAGYTFSSPYFYENGSNNAFALATSQEDPQFGDFVFWVVMATFFAEENGISQATAKDMPLVYLFGEDFKSMFLDCIYEVGSYGDMYYRNLGAFLPRTGRNNLNQDSGPQQFAFPFV